MTKPKPDMALSEVVDRLSGSLAITQGARDRGATIDGLIMDAVVQRDLLTWGRKLDMGEPAELIAQFDWEFGQFSHERGTLISRHPDSPLPEEYGNIHFSRAEVEAWVRGLGADRLSSRCAEFIWGGSGARLLFMRKSLILLPVLLCAAPAVAQPAPQLPPRLSDPATADRLANVMQALSKALLDLPAGDVQAALEGRQPTPAEKRMTVRDIARRDVPNFDRNFQQRIADTKPMIRQSMKALNDALPAMMQGLTQAQKSLERAIANMPDPTYPKR